MTAEIGIIAGSGLYDLAGLEDTHELRLDTPFGAPSDAIRVGRWGTRRVAFLARHGRRHTLLPGEVNYCANLWALKQLGVGRVLAVSAVGSMREAIVPRDVVLVDQFIDRTVGRRSTFFGEGLVAHVALADPICPATRAVLRDCAGDCGARAHDGGTYLCMEGPAFSTRAESRLHRSWGVDVIGMTNATEAKLAREAELCYAVLALVTDFDCWHAEEADVSVATLLDNLRANAELAVAVLRAAVTRLPLDRDACACATALDHAIITPLDAVPPATLARLRPLLT